jgi:hypothetical protein
MSATGYPEIELQTRLCTSLPATAKLRLRHQGSGSSNRIFAGSSNRFSISFICGCGSFSGSPGEVSPVGSRHRAAYRLPRCARRWKSPLHTLGQGTRPWRVSERLSIKREAMRQSSSICSLREFWFSKIRSCMSQNRASKRCFQRWKVGQRICTGRMLVIGV